MSHKIIAFPPRTKGYNYRENESSRKDIFKKWGKMEQKKVSWKHSSVCKTGERPFLHCTLFAHALSQLPATNEIPQLKLCSSGTFNTPLVTRNWTSVLLWGSQQWLNVICSAGPLKMSIPEVFIPPHTPLLATGLLALGRNQLTKLGYKIVITAWHELRRKRRTWRNFILSWKQPCWDLHQHYLSPTAPWDRYTFGSRALEKQQPLLLCLQPAR